MAHEENLRFSRWHELWIFVLAPAVVLEVINRLFDPPIWVLFVVGFIPLCAMLHLFWTWTAIRLLGRGKTVAVLGIVILYVVGAVKASNLENQKHFRAEEEDTWRNIQIDFSLPPNDKGDPMKSLITVTNNSMQNLTSKHLLLCQSILTVSPGGLLDQATMWAQSNKEIGQWYLVYRYPKPEEIEASFPISGNGTNGRKDSTTESCLSHYNTKPPISCYDLRLIFFYFLEDHPDAMLYVVKRIAITRDEDGNYTWRPEALEKKGSPCCPPEGTEFHDFNKWCYGDELGPRPH